MHTRLTRQQIASYRENGFLVLGQFLTPEELEEWRAAVDEAVAQRGDLRIPTTGSRTTDDTYYGKVFIQRVNLWQTSERVKKIMLDERLGRLASELEGVEGMRIWHDQALIKPPAANQTSWHADNPYWSFTSPHAISIWVALDDATIANGCLHFLPGTHRLFDESRPVVSITPDMNALFKVYPEWKRIAPVAAPMKAGQCSFHNGRTAHAAGPNLTHGWRRAMTCGYMPVGSTFNGKQNILSREDFERLKIGDELALDDKHPVLWRRQASPAAAR